MMAVMVSTSNLTLEELVENDTLGLTVVVPGDLTTRVRGAHTMEIEHPGRWLEPGWLMLTTGLQFLGDVDPAEQAGLVRELKEAKAAGIAFGVDVNFSEVPPALVEAARESDLSLLTIDARVPFLQVESFVNRSLAASETYLVKRALWLQTDLLQTLSSEQPLNTLISRIGQLIKGVAIVYDEAGVVVASTGSGPARLIWGEIRAREPRRQRFSVGRWHVATRPTVLGGLGYWIALGSQRRSVLDDLAEPLLDSAQRLLGAIHGTSILKAARARAESDELLATLNGVVESTEAQRLWDRLAAFRFRARSPLRAFVSGELQGTGPRDDAAMAMTLDRLVEEALSSGLPLIVRERDTDDTRGLIGLAADSAVLHEWVEKLGETQHVGVSESFVEIPLARRNFRDARRASLVAQRRMIQRIASSNNQAQAKEGTPDGILVGGVVRFEDVDLATWLLSSRSGEAIKDKTRQQLGDLLDRTDLADTVVAYLASGLDIQRTAARLFLHPNSVRYRLRRIEEIIDAPMTSPSTLANIYLAFHERLAAGDARTGA
jgi:purine catabolism regulator